MADKSAPSSNSKQDKQMGIKCNAGNLTTAIISPHSDQTQYSNSNKKEWYHHITPHDKHNTANLRILQRQAQKGKIPYLLKILTANRLILLLCDLPEFFLKLSGLLRELHKCDRIKDETMRGRHIRLCINKVRAHTCAWRSRTREPASSIKSMALSGRKRSLKNRVKAQHKITFQLSK